MESNLPSSINNQANSSDENMLEIIRYTSQRFRFSKSLLEKFTRKLLAEDSTENVINRLSAIENCFCNLTDFIHHHEIKS